MRIWAALLLLVWSAAEGQGVAVVYTDGRPPVALTSVIREGVVYHRLDEYASSLNGVVTWIPARRRAAMITGRDSVAVTVDSRFLTVNGQGVCLDHPAILAEGIVLVPESFAQAVPPLLNSVRAAWVDSLGQLQVEGTPCDVQLIRVVEESLSVRLEINVPSHADWMLTPFHGDSVILSMRGATVCPSDFDSLLTDSAVVALSARQEPGQAVLAGHRRRNGMQARCTSSGTLLSLVFGRFPPPVIPLRPVLRIMLDAGHGGADAGARSADGTAEKDITLSAARMVATRLKERHRDIEVLLTRETDILLPSTLRVEQANSRAVDVFISLHCNWSFDKSLRGLRAGFPSPGNSGRSSGVVAGDGVVWPDDSGGRAPGRPAGGITRWDNAHDSWIPVSQSLSGSVSDAAQVRGIPTRHPLQAPLAILEGLSMPGIMIELGYLSNPVEARDLVTLDYLEGLADAVGEGISRFVTSLRQPEGQQ